MKQDQHNRATATTSTAATRDSPGRSRKHAAAPAVYTAKLSSLSKVLAAAGSTFIGLVRLVKILWVLELKGGKVYRGVWKLRVSKLRLTRQ